MRTVNAIIVGAGGFARQHIRAMLALRRTTAIVGLVEPSEKSRAATAIAAYAQQHWKAGTTGTWRQNPAISGGGFLFDPGAHMIKTVVDLIGVIPKALAHEVSHRGLTELHIVDSMHDRKRTMFELADGFIALPGGFGTLEEIAELVTWAQLGWHTKPCGLLNVAGYYDSLLAFLDHAVAQGFMKQVHRDMLLVADEPCELLARFATYRAPRVKKWLAPEPEKNRSPRTVLPAE
jgi:uncharacterized protein (TIGR00730 family)